MNKIVEMLDEIATGDEDFDRVLRHYAAIGVCAMSGRLGLVETKEAGTGRRVFAIVLDMDGTIVPVARMLMGPVAAELETPEGARLVRAEPGEAGRTPAINGPGGDA
jgi:hypothetical protein